MDPLADIYKIIGWEQDEEKHWKHGYHLCWDQNWDPNYMLCEKNILPKSRAVEFINYEPGKEPTWANPVFLYEDEDWNADSYRTLCKGDSGSGQFITNGMEFFMDTVTSNKVFNFRI